MKIINEKGKLFGLINIVDLLVLIAAVAVAAGVGYPRSRSRSSRRSS